MKIFQISIIAVFFALFAMSCNNTSNHEHAAASIELNNGQKWVVNAEMKPYILEGEQLLLNYDGTDYKQLAEGLKAKNKGLIKSCTMDGKSHDELHKWLHPHMQLIDALDDAENKEDADKIIAELTSSFQTYHANFQ